MLAVVAVLKSITPDPFVINVNELAPVLNVAPSRFIFPPFAYAPIEALLAVITEPVLALITPLPVV